MNAGCGGDGVNPSEFNQGVSIPKQMGFIERINQRLSYHQGKVKELTILRAKIINDPELEFILRDNLREF